MADQTRALAEENRKRLTGDDKYASKGLFLFVLHGPAGRGPFAPGQSRIQFPLVINPDSFNYTLPFAAQLTALQEGGVTSEEGGVVIGEIDIEGTTGFKLRTSLSDTSARRSDGEFTSDLDPGGKNQQSTPASVLLSGHMHFWRLANRCFDGYSALKKNPATAAATRMEFHSLKDDLHLLVVPREFRLTRSAARERVTYRYEIRLAVVGAATDAVSGGRASPDRKLLDQKKNVVAVIRSAIQGGRAQIEDLRAAQDDLRRKVLSIAGILDDAAEVFDSASAVIDGTIVFLDFPRVFATALNGLIDSAADFVNPDEGEGWRGAKQALLGLADNIDRLLAASRDLWIERMSGKTDGYEARTRGYQQGQDPIRDGAVTDLRAEANNGQGRMSVSKAFGGGVRPGDVERGQADPIEAESRFQPNRYQGYREVVVAQGDSIQSLAAKHMGDPNEWPVIAVANALKAPYVTNGVRLPGTVAPGDRVVVPIQEALSNPDTFTTGNPEQGGSQAEALLGVDFERERLANGQFGWSIDVAGGSTDVFKARGVPNLEQAIDGRLRTTQGENILYPRFGLPRLVGNRAFGDDIVNERYLVRRQLLDDPRIERIVSLRFFTEEDRLEIEADVQPVGFTSVRTIARTLT
jgi:hypothetical protein